METKVVRDVEDRRDLSWTKYRNSSGTAGSFLKATETIDGRKYYYKLSNYDPFRGIVGHECVNEIIADRLLTVLGIPHLHYQLRHAVILLDGREYKTWLCVSENFRKRGESKLAMDVFYELHRIEGESPLSFCIRMGWGHFIYNMLLTDYLILNRDRHGANLEVLRSKDSQSVRPAPLFDHGVSLLFSCHTDEEAQKEDLLADKPVQCFVGSQSARTNLDLIPSGFSDGVNELQESDEERILQDLNGSAPDAVLRYSWRMIWERWCVFQSIRERNKPDASF